MNNKILSLFRERKFPFFFLYRHGGPINMQSIAAEEQNVKMELTKWYSRSISGIQSLQSQCKSDLFWGCSKQQPHGVALQFLELLLKNGPFKKLVHVSGGGGRGRGDGGENFRRAWIFLVHFSLLSIIFLMFDPCRGRQSEGTVAGLCNDSDCSEGSKGMTKTLNVATKKISLAALMTDLYNTEACFNIGHSSFYPRCLLQFS